MHQHKLKVYKAFLDATIHIELLKKKWAIFTKFKPLRRPTQRHHCYNCSKQTESPKAKVHWN